MRYSSRKRFLGFSAGLPALVLAGSPIASAQDAEKAPATPASTAPADSASSSVTDVGEVVVVGTRASQRTAIERKKKASTAMDSISAEDVGRFPDQNVDEAISRVSGVALDRGDNGEGQGISIRGNSMETTHVEIDGMSVLNSNGALSGGTGAGAGGRAADRRELPAAMIKTLDVVKGTTAAMTEGSLGGSVIIETRNGLDFDKPFLQLSMDGQRNAPRRLGCR